MGSLPAAQAGVGSAVNDTTRELGGALGVAIMGSIGSSIFVQRFHSVLVHVPAALAAPARSSVGAAVTIGQRTQATMGPALVHGARHAFMTGADYAVLVAAGAALLGAVVAIRFLPARAAEAGEAESAVSLTRPAAHPELATV
jgi:hypothetical protein